jgi:hypothetical protein
MSNIQDQDDYQDDVLMNVEELLLVEQKPKLSFEALLPRAEMKLTESERDQLVAIQTSFVILGPAAGAVLVCPGNQEDLQDDQKCPYAKKCPLLRFKKAPKGDLCPIERAITEQRFTSWCKTIEVDPTELTEDTRIFVSEMVWMDIQEQRCLNILSTGEAARLTQVNITDAINFTSGDQGNLTQETLPLTWERVLHVSTLRLDAIQDRRRLLLKDWMLTPEQKWRRQKAEGKAKGGDLGSAQSAIGDKLRSLDSTFE